MKTFLSFQEIIQALQSFWAEHGCVILSGFDDEVGAGTLSPYTALHCVTDSKISLCYPQFSTRPTDSRFAQNPNRLGSYYQFQVILKPSEDFGDIQMLYLKSLNKINIDTTQHDVRFIEDDWKNESIGAFGLGFEVWCDGMEVTQFTYIQSIGGLDCDIISCEITYGLERIAMYTQDKDSIFDLVWGFNKQGNHILYKEIHSKLEEIQRSQYFSVFQDDTEELKRRVEADLDTVATLLNNAIPMVFPAYRKCLNSSHALNILDARGAISAQERMSVILKIKECVKNCIIKHKESQFAKNI